MGSKGLRWSMVIFSCLLVLFGFWIYYLRYATVQPVPASPTSLPRVQKVIVLSANDMQNQQSAELVHSLKQLINDNENLRAVILDAKGQKDRQITQLKEIDRSSVAGLILLPVDRLADLNDAISLFSQPVVPILSLTQPAEDSQLKPFGHVTSISFDALETGRQQAAYCAKRLSGQGRVVILAGPQDQAATQQMIRGIQEVFQQFSGLEIAGIQYGDWSRQSGYASMDKILVKDQDFAAIIAQSDGMLLGALPLVSSKRSQPVKIGTGATTEGLQALSQGYIDATISTGSKQIARTAFNAMMAAINGDVAADQFQSPRLIDRDNLEEYVREIWNVN